MKFIKMWYYATSKIGCWSRRHLCSKTNLCGMSADFGEGRGCSYRDRRTESTRSVKRHKEPY